MAFNSLKSQINLPEGELIVEARYGMSRFSSQLSLNGEPVSEDELFFNAGDHENGSGASCLDLIR